MYLTNLIFIQTVSIFQRTQVKEPHRGIKEPHVALAPQIAEPCDRVFVIEFYMYHHCMNLRFSRRRQ